MLNNRRSPSSDLVEAQPVVLVADQTVIQEMVSESAIFVEKQWNVPSKALILQWSQQRENIFNVVWQRMRGMFRQTLPRSLTGIRFELSELNISMDSALILEPSYGTTKSVLADLINMIARNNKMQEKIKAELIDAEYDYKNKLLSYVECFTDSNISKLRYLEKLINEAMKTHSTCVHQIRFPFNLFRSTERNDRLETSWDHLEGGKACICTMVAFGRGPRECQGTRFARNNLRFILCNILAEYDFHLITYEKDEIDIQMDISSGEYGNLVRVTKNPIRRPQP